MFADPLSDRVQNSFFYGRSADILLQRKDLTEEKSAVFIPSNNFINSWPAGASLEEKSVADIISAVVGGPVINEDVSRTNFPTINMFNKASANVLLLVDGISSDEAKDLKVVKQDGTFVPLTKSSYPQDLVSTAASMSTGNTPSEHGIVGAQWFAGKSLLEAYKQGAHPVIASFADVIMQLYGADVSVLSTSMSYQLAAAFGAHPYLQSVNKENHVYAWDTKTERFTDIYDDESSVKLSFAKLISKIALRNFGVESSLDFDTMILTIGEVKFSMNAPEHLAFFAEMEALLHSVKSHIKNNRKELNLYNIVISSYKSLIAIAKPAQKEMARVILEQYIDEIITSLSQTYGDKMIIEYIFMGENNVELMKKDRETVMMAYNAINHYVDSYNSFDIFYPQIHLVRKSLLDRNMCINLQKKLKSHTEVICPSLDVVRTVFRRADNGSTTATTTGTPGTTAPGPLPPSDDDTFEYVTYFHILIWFNILLFFVALFAVYGLCAMDPGADSLLYRMTSTNRR